MNAARERGNPGGVFRGRITPGRGRKTNEPLGGERLGLARRIEQLSENVLQLNEGTVYTSLLRLQQEGWIASSWGTSENNRKARFYTLTAHGREQLAAKTTQWHRLARAMALVLQPNAEGV